MLLKSQKMQYFCNINAKNVKRITIYQVVLKKNLYVLLFLTLQNCIRRNLKNKS